MTSRPSRLAGVAAASLATIATVLGILAGPAAAQSPSNPCGPPVVNPIVCENSLPGDPPSDWQVSGAGDSDIQGFATSMSVDVGQTESFKIDTNATAYHIDILRLGYYGGDGARMIQSDVQPTATLPQTQPACLENPGITNANDYTGLIDCGNWGVSASWAVPSTAVSGVYIAHLVIDAPSSEAGDDSQIIFVVRNDASHSQILVSTSDATWEAYNDYGGNSLYTCTVECPPGNPLAYKAAYAVSYNRPFDGSFTTDAGQSYLYYAEYQLIYWLEENGYDVSYTSDSELDASSSLIEQHKIFISSGHDEYWSANERANVQAAINDGVNAIFMSGNEVFWKTRWADSADGSNTPYRTLITYKETHFNAPTDPDDPPTWTGSWIDPRFSPPADGGQPPNALTGQLFEVNAGTTNIQVPYQDSQLRLWRNTAVAGMTPSESPMTLDAATSSDPTFGLLGYEWDSDIDNGFRPAGEIDESSTTANDVETFTDYGSTLNDPGGCPCDGTATHSLTEYRAPSGALVFATGTVQWSWGLAQVNPWGYPTTEPDGGNPPDPTIEQATVNVLADMGAQPTSLNAPDDCPTTTPCLVTGSPSTVTTPPTSTITSPTSGTQIADGSAVTITGTATDKSGGVVAGVEVSTDGGNTWHPATLTEPDGTTVTWSYSWVAHGYPSTTIESRATDDSDNTETPSDGVTVDVNCPCSVFGTGTTPMTADSGDTASYVLGMEFQSSVGGYVTGVRFYKAATNTGTHVGSLWSSSGTLLGSATFTSESASGWQTVTFSSPLAISANTTYMVGYSDPNGHYADYPYYFYTPPPFGDNALNAPPLSALPANGEGGSNGFYVASPSSATTFPTSNSEDTNYYVDPVFIPATPPGQVTGVSGTAGPASVSLTWSAPSSGGVPTSYVITPYIGSTAQTTTTVSGSPPATSATISGLTAGTAYTFTVQAVNPSGSGAVSAASAPVTPTTPPAPGAPSGASAIGASSRAQVSWTDPTTGGPPTSYVITPYVGSTAEATTTVNSGTATSATVTGLNNGVSYTFKVAASDAGGTSAQSPASNAVTPADTIFDFATPSTIDSGDGSAVTLGVKFQSSVAGTVTGIRFYKASTNAGTHVGSLWSSSGSLLASATFSGESASGWQTVTFSSPVSIAANTTYVAGYFAPDGHYSAASGGFSSAVTNGPLTGLANSTSSNGVYAYGSSSTFPASTFDSTNYYVDVDFLPASVPGQVTGVSGTAGAGAVSLSWTAPTTGGAPTSYVITPYIGSTAQATTTISGSPPATSTTITGLTAGTAYTFTVQAVNGAGSGLVSAASSPVTPTTPAAPGAPSGASAIGASSQAQVSWTAPTTGGAPSSYIITPYIGGVAQTTTTVNSGTATSATVSGLNNGTSYTFTVAAHNGGGTSGQSATSNAVTPADTIFDFTTPSTVDSGDTSAVELGVKFQSSVAGTVTGIRFYKASTNAGTHVGSLWSSSGSLLASATFSGESASGWQTVTFSSPVSIAANTTYVAGYFAPDGHYSAASNAFASVGVTNGPLQALANPTSPDGVYAYASSSTFPASTFDSTNYYVDLDFLPTSLPGQVTGVSGTAGTQSVNLSWSAPTTGGAPTSYVITPYIGSTAQATTTVSGAPPATSATITGLTAGTAYTFTVQAVNTSGSGAVSAASAPVTPNQPAPPGAPTAVSAAPASGEALVSWTAPTTGGAPTSYVITPYIGSTAQATTTVSNGSATSAIVSGLQTGTSYTFTVAASNGGGTGTKSTASGAVTPADTIFDFAAPTEIDSGDPNAVELGVKFQSSEAGTVTGIRFYKASTNTGTHTGSLWTSSGTLLASATFSNETASGWQTVLFSAPVTISANTTYVAGYYAPNGHYSAANSAFASVGVTNGPLQALANGTSSDGVYAYGSSSAFPSNTWESTNYYVDVDFLP